MKVENDNRFHLEAQTTERGQRPHLQPERPLSSAPLNRWFRIDRLEGPQQDCDRLLDLGLTPGEEVAVTQTAPLGDPIVIHVRGALLALRKREAGWIWVL